MTQAKITKQEGYLCAPDGFDLVTFGFGTIVAGKVAEWALADNAAQRMFEPREGTKVEVVSETKTKPRSRTKKGTS
jgi:hypothetical protein|tara:strand:- start:13324 stop:13551 length:228 start_codon:yes stop_codon:yes gene_type:complete